MFSSYVICDLVTFFRWITARAREVPSVMGKIRKMSEMTEIKVVPVEHGEAAFSLGITL